MKRKIPFIIGIISFILSLILSFLIAGLFLIALFFSPIMPLKLQDLFFLTGLIPLIISILSIIYLGKKEKIQEIDVRDKILFALNLILLFLFASAIILTIIA